jgi:hypothetical protein
MGVVSEKVPAEQHAADRHPRHQFGLGHARSIRDLARLPRSDVVTARNSCRARGSEGYRR